MGNHSLIGIEKTLRQLYQQPASIEMVKNQHRAIFEAIRTHDPAAAQAAMRTHITFVCDFFASQGATLHLTGQPDR